MGSYWSRWERSKHKKGCVLQGEEGWGGTRQGEHSEWGTPRVRFLAWRPGEQEGRRTTPVSPVPL